MELRNKFLKVGWVAALLEACSAKTGTDSSNTPVNTTGSTSSTILSTTPTTTSVVTTSPSATTSFPTTANTNTTVSVTSLPANTSTTTSTATTPAPTSSKPSVNKTTVPASTSTNPNSQVTQRQLFGANQGRAFGFSAAGRIYFYDKISGKTGTYTFDPNQANSQLQFLTSDLGIFVPDLSLVSVSSRPNNITTIVQVKDGIKKATLQNRASPTLISPDKTRVAYLLRSLTQDGPEEPQYFELWVGNLDGSNLKKVWNLREGANLSWFPDNHSLLLTARDQSNQRFGLWIVDVDGPVGQNKHLIVESKGLILAALSSDGNKVAYNVTFQGENNSGIWSANKDGSDKHKFEWIGGWRWSPNNPNELIYIPIKSANETSNVLWSYDFGSGQSQRLTNSATIPVFISGDEWQLAPDGKHLAYRNAKDNAIWYLTYS